MEENREKKKVACGKTITSVFFLFRFAISDNAFRLLLEENRSQCILISGEFVRLGWEDVFRGEWEMS
jgi:hypothetical protein